MWVVRVGDDLYARSAHGPDNPWYWRARAVGAVDAAYHHAKYDRYGPRIVGSVTGRNTHPLTVRLAKAGRQETRYS
jgi:hypothetical protein